MRFVQTFAALLATLATVGMAGKASATVTDDSHPAYTLTWDETTVFGNPSFSFGSGAAALGFGWSVPTALNVATIDQQVTATFTLPAVTVTAKPGWRLGGLVEAFIGNITYVEFGGLTAISGAGLVAVDGGPVRPLAGALTKTVTSAVPGVFETGYFSATLRLPVPNFNSLAFSGGSLTLSAVGGRGAAITGQLQNQMSLSFEAVAAPVPEPASWALLLAGLGVVATGLRRRRAG
ncbi:PEP-CTERM sorting domain-containing protein [Rubrivivax sp. A210]|uniref:PEPxxWA-CTERM sorting domain-containing protein n=1 Tax=Rubrivivax sp. A210 TaxID=2772301 RepID=UPI0019C2E72C|nr:PEPxxWA-CTERM sorting domain-containing protein [Rubrivivax sp. A210]CAD5373449.1 PEP-CTERM sorting domain-containing protein [Rubrivivax sp. A210]